jgi:hypothetical protein
MKTKTFPILLAIFMLAATIQADDMAVTVYNSDLGVVSETRTLDFKTGVERLAFRDVPSQIDPNSVRFEVVGKDQNISILEQSYLFDLVSSDKLYDKYVDQRIELSDNQGRLYSGKLLAYSGSNVTLMNDSGKVKVVSLKEVAEVNFPLLPEGLITRPTLSWLYQSERSGATLCRVSYQTGGMNWTAEYVGVLDEKETTLDLSGWGAINNTSGKTYTDATLKLVAGTVHRVEDVRLRGGRVEMADMAYAPMAKGGFEEKGFFEYHLYTLPRKATLVDKEQKQISLFEPARASVKKVFMYQPDMDADNVKVKVEFKNSKEAGLGMPLPAGRVRMFKADSDGSMILLGEDQIDHTPKDEEVSLSVGDAFDVVGEHQMVNQTRITKSVEEREFEVKLRNRKADNIQVTVEKQLWGFWEVTKSSLPYEKKNANTVKIVVPVPANDSATVNLTVRFDNQ